MALARWGHAGASTRPVIQQTPHSPAEAGDVTSCSRIPRLGLFAGPKPLGTDRSMRAGSEHPKPMTVWMLSL